MNESPVPDADGAADLPDSFLTLAAAAESELRIQRSRFIGLAAPALDADTARACVAAAAARFHDARHVCHGWRLGPPPLTAENRNDDGEPAGTAGEPILAALRRAELTDCVVMVVRYFGGIKLGTGGLARAYGQAAEEALAAAPRRTVRLGRTFDLEFDYALQKTVRHLLEGARGEVRDEQYAERVRWRLWLPHSTWRGFGTALVEATAGAVALPAEAPPTD